MLACMPGHVDVPHVPPPFLRCPHLQVVTSEPAFFGGYSWWLRWGGGGLRGYMTDV